MRPPVLVMHASGTNRDGEAAAAVELAGGSPRIVHVNRLRSGKARIADHAAVLLPGGFSYGDALGAGGRLALELRAWFADELGEAVRLGRPVLGICNGFQALVKAGLLPGSDPPQSGRTAPRRTTLTVNENGRFECRWVTLGAESTLSSSWLSPVAGSVIECPVAHGEGRLVTSCEASDLTSEGLVAFRYLARDCFPQSSDLQAGTQHSIRSGPIGRPGPANGEYPANPNGSADDIAGLVDRSGTVVGLMPHPEDHVLAWQRPSGPPGNSGLALFAAFVNACR